eukprot:m51a1_g6671 putative hd phosphohydrolase domain-containing protein (450) ;mRNA; f:201476-204339
MLSIPGTALHSRYSLDHTPSKLVNDPIHGHVRIPGECMKIVDTPTFQRLRDLYQLGTTYLVFPGASHHRFEHSLGVCHLAGQMAQNLAQTVEQPAEYQRRIELVRIAGLCHDLGHGPFSHVFESWAKSLGPQFQDWEHEDMSCRLLDNLLTGDIGNYDTEEVKFMQNAIRGESMGHEEDGWLFQIVKNQKNSVDVDKFDYLARDSYMLGMKSTYDCSRLMNHSRAIGGDICFHKKEAYNVYELFHTRYALFKQVYTHRVGRAIEFMLMDVLNAADPYMHYSERLWDVNEYWKLTDSVLRDIEFSTCEELREARSIMERVRRRNLYKLVAEVLLPANNGLPDLAGAEREIASLGDAGLKESDLILEGVSLNYAMKDKNPVDNVKFFVSSQTSVAVTVPKQHVSLLIPDQFEERHVRLFCRNPSPIVMAPAREAFAKWLKERGLEPIPDDR